MPSPEKSRPAEPKVSVEAPGPPPDRNQSLVWSTAGAVMILGIALSLFQLYTAGIVAFTALTQRSVHLGSILCLTWLLKPPFEGARKDKFSVWLFIDLALIALTIYSCFYINWNLFEIFERQGDWLTEDRLVSFIGVLLVLEACRRVVGGVMTGICVAAVVYAFTLGDIILAVLACMAFIKLSKKPLSWHALVSLALTGGYWLYGYGLGGEPYLFDVLLHKPYSVERITTTLWLTTEGIFGLPIGVAATFVFVFVLFGAFLEVTGGGSFFIDLAYALTGRFSGGPAKTSVIASGFMGSVSGSAVGNVVATGSFTIPMMKKVGYRAHVAGAIEAAASTGGQLMPPIMGAGAFLMAELTSTPYLDIIKIALVPAILYYLTVLLFVHFEAQKHGLMGQPRETLPRVGKVLINGLHFLIPVAILIYVLVENYSPMFCGFVAVVSVAAISLVFNGISNSMGRGGERLAWGNFLAREGRGVLSALEQGAKNAIMVSIACAAAGIIVGMVTLTGMGLKFSSLVLDLSFGIKAIAIILIGAASLVLGMGLPVTASYIVLSTLAGPALLDMGVPLVVTHMIVFWYSQDANVTPPVSLASFAGAGVAGANPMQTAFTSWKLAKGLYIIPIVMAYRPLLGVMEGKVYNLWHWKVGWVMISTALGLVAFAAALDRFLLRRAYYHEVVLFVLAAIGLFWPDLKLGRTVIPGEVVNIVGLGLLAAAALSQKLLKGPGPGSFSPVVE